MAGSRDNVKLLLAREVDELDCIAGHADGEVCILLLLGVLHGVNKLFLAEDVHVQVVSAALKVAIKDANQVRNPLLLGLSEGVGVYRLGVGNTV